MNILSGIGIGVMIIVSCLSLMIYLSNTRTVFKYGINDDDPEGLEKVLAINKVIGLGVILLGILGFTLLLISFGLGILAAIVLLTIFLAGVTYL